MLSGRAFYVFNTRQERLCARYAYRFMLLGEDNHKFCRISGKILLELKQNLKVYRVLIILMEERQSVHVMQSCRIWHFLRTLAYQHHTLYKT